MPDAASFRWVSDVAPSAIEVALQLRVSRTINLAHSTGTKRRADYVRPNNRALSERHEYRDYNARGFGRTSSVAQVLAQVLCITSSINASD
jgi:hypothetical protein